MIEKYTFRSSHRRCSVAKGVLRNFAKLTGKRQRQCLFFNKVAGVADVTCNFIKKEILAQVFSFEFCEISKNTFFTENIWATASVIPFMVPLKYRKCFQKDLTLIITFRNNNCVIIIIVIIHLFQFGFTNNT